MKNEAGALGLLIVALLACKKEKMPKLGEDVDAAADVASVRVPLPAPRAEEPVVQVPIARPVASIAPPQPSEEPTPAVRFVHGKPVLGQPTRAAATAFAKKIGVPLHASPLADGTARLMGRAANGGLNVEIIGTDEGLESLGLMFQIPIDAPAVRERNNAAIAGFMRETGWPGGETWVAGAVKAGEGSQVHGAVKYAVHVVTEVGTITLDADPVGAE